MTKQHPVKAGTPAAIALHDDALDQAAGGVLASGTYGRGVYRLSLDDGVATSPADQTLTFNATGDQP